MRCYKVSVNLTDKKKIKWAGTQADVKVAKDEFKANYGKDRKPEVEEVDVPYDKAGLLAFLNDNINEEKL
jgi:hypothetical protein